MTTHILNILCEGQTEERFASHVLKEHLKSFGLIVKPIILNTNKKKEKQGGMISYKQVKTDLVTLKKQVSTRTSEKHYFTTMFDLYALPKDFPGYKDPSPQHDCDTITQSVKTSFSKDLTWGDYFIPYIQVHEFEALVFCGLDHLLTDYPEMKTAVQDLKKVLDSYQGNPELINSSPQTAPSKRIIKAFGKINYDKVKSGTQVTTAVGIEVLKSKCPHFRSWVETLEKLPTSNGITTQSTSSPTPPPCPTKSKP